MAEILRGWVQATLPYPACNRYCGTCRWVRTPPSARAVQHQPPLGIQPTTNTEGLMHDSPKRRGLLLRNPSMLALQELPLTGSLNTQAHGGEEREEERANNEDRQTQPSVFSLQPHYGKWLEHCCCQHGDICHFVCLASFCGSVALNSTSPGCPTQTDTSNHRSALASQRTDQTPPANTEERRGARSASGVLCCPA